MGCSKTGNQRKWCCSVRCEFGVVCVVLEYRAVKETSCKLWMECYYTHRFQVAPVWAKALLLLVYCLKFTHPCRWNEWKKQIRMHYWWPFVLKENENGSLEILRPFEEEGDVGFGKWWFAIMFTNSGSRYFRKESEETKGCCPLMNRKCSSRKFLGFWKYFHENTMQVRYKSCPSSCFLRTRNCNDMNLQLTGSSSCLVEKFSVLKKKNRTSRQLENFE